MLYLLATLALVVRVNAQKPMPKKVKVGECLECCTIDGDFGMFGLEPDEVSDLDFPYVLRNHAIWEYMPYLWENLDEDEEVPEVEYWIQKTAESYNSMDFFHQILKVDGEMLMDWSVPVPVGTKYVMGKLSDPDDWMSEPIWSNAAAECIEKDGEYIWSTSIGDVFVALFDRDNAECAYVNGEDVNECDGPIEPVEPVAPVEPVTPPVEPATDSIEIEDPEPAVTTVPETPVDDTTNQSDLGDDNSGVDTNADIDDNQIVQQLQDSSASPTVAKQSVPTWVIPTAAGGIFVVALSLTMYVCKQKVVRNALPDIEAPQAAPQPLDIEAQNVQIVTQEA